MKVIEIIISPRGETRLETKGCAGAECREASRFVEHALGTRLQEHLASEFYRVETQPERLHEGS